MHSVNFIFHNMYEVQIDSILTRHSGGLFTFLYEFKYCIVNNIFPIYCDFFGFELGCNTFFFHILNQNIFLQKGIEQFSIRNYIYKG